MPLDGDNEDNENNDITETEDEECERPKRMREREKILKTLLRFSVLAAALSGFFIKSIKPR